MWGDRKGVSISGRPLSLQVGTIAQACFRRRSCFVYSRKHYGGCENVFFFQAEDGIRDYKVTGVQTCALPISAPAKSCSPPAGISKKPRRECRRIATTASADWVGSSNCPT